MTRKKPVDKADLQRRGRTVTGALRGTAIHSVRVDSELWAAAGELASAEGRSVGDVIRELLANWVADNGRDMS